MNGFAISKGFDVFGLCHAHVCLWRDTKDGLMLQLGAQAWNRQWAAGDCINTRHADTEKHGYHTLSTAWRTAPTVFGVTAVAGIIIKNRA
jgi:hypothetical protein